jgi:GT2 family glycosyltransferase
VSDGPDSRRLRPPTEPDRRPGSIVVDGIVVTWNEIDDTIRCVESLIANAAPLRRVRVIDNGSNVDVLAALRRALPPCADVVALPANLGFGAGCNAGIDLSMREGADFVWVVNNDAVVEPTALRPLLEVADRDPTTGIVGSRVVLADRPQVIWHEGGVIDVIRGIAYNDREGWIADPPGPPRSTPYVSGCSMLLRTSCLREIGAFDPRFFLYLEDTELCLRAQRHGWRVVIQPASLVHHKVSASTSRLPRRVAFLKDRNRTLFALACSHGWMARSLALAYHGARAVRDGLSPATGRDRASHLRAFRTGVRAALTRSPEAPAGG